MLHQLELEYKDGTKEIKIIHTEAGELITIYPKRDNIKTAGHKVFKYYLPRWRGLTKAIVRFENRYVIMPHGVECHPKTTMDDIVIVDEPTPKPPKTKEEKPMVWKFTSSDGKGKYQVRQDMGKLKCNCMGFWKSKGNCKHVKEVRIEIEGQK
jgi:hypothetical protein